MKIGFVGLGTMGGAMAANLVAAGHRPLVWNRTPAKAEGVDGVDIAPSLAALAAQSEVVFVCVSDTADVEEVAGTLLDSMTAGIIVDHSTISPLATESLAKAAAEKGIEWLDAPVSGGSEGAASGTLAVMVGGPPEALEAVRPFLESYSSSIVHIGEKPGSGQMAKLVNQVLVVINQLAVSEALLMADAAGLDLPETISAVEGGAAGSWMLSNRGPQMVVRDWRPGFTIDLQQKDLRLVLDAADELGVPTPGTALVFQLYRALQSRGLGSEGNHALVKALEEMSGRKMGSAE
jgi:3-hydroxyisobutyrate dehydrogenase-like beta-hydroxyacid dehydrogenase